MVTLVSSINSQEVRDAANNETVRINPRENKSLEIFRNFIQTVPVSDPFLVFKKICNTISSWKNTAPLDPYLETKQKIQDLIEGRFTAEKIRSLLDERATINTFIDQPLPNGELPLNYAIRLEKSHTVDFLLKYFKINYTETDYNKQSALHIAKLMNNKKILEVVSKYIPDLDLKFSQLSINDPLALSYSEYLLFTITVANLILNSTGYDFPLVNTVMPWMQLAHFLSLPLYENPPLIMGILGVLLPQWGIKPLAQIGGVVAKIVCCSAFLTTLNVVAANAFTRPGAALRRLVVSTTNSYGMLSETINSVKNFAENYFNPPPSLPLLCVLKPATCELIKGIEAGGGQCKSDYRKLIRMIHPDKSNVPRAVDFISLVESHKEKFCDKERMVTEFSYSPPTSGNAEINQCMHQGDSKELFNRMMSTKNADSSATYLDIQDKCFSPHIRKGGRNCQSIYKLYEEESSASNTIKNLYAAFCNPKTKVPFLYNENDTEEINNCVLDLYKENEKLITENRWSGLELYKALKEKC